MFEIAPADTPALGSALRQLLRGRNNRLGAVNEEVWIVEADVRAILSPAASEREQRLLGPEYAVIDGTALMGFSEAGLLRLIELGLMRRGGEASTKKFWH